MRGDGATIAQAFGRHETWWYCMEVLARSSSMPQFPPVDPAHQGNDEKWFPSFPRQRASTGSTDHGRAWPRVDGVPETAGSGHGSGN